MAFVGGQGSSSAAPEGMVSPGGRSLNGSHAIASFAICERLGDLRYDKRYVTLQDKPYRLRGTLIHLCLAYYYASKMPEEKRPRWFFEKDLQTALEEVGAGLPDGIRRAKEVLCAYREHWPENVWQAQTIEEEFIVSVKEIDPIDDELQELKLRLAREHTREERARLEVQLAELEYLKTFDDELVSCKPDLIARTLAGTATGPELWMVDYKSRAKTWGDKKGLEKWNDDGEFALNWQVLVNLIIVRAPSNARKLDGLPVKGFVIERITREPDKDNRYYFDRHILTIPRRAYELTPRLIRKGVARQHEVREKVKNGIMPTPNFWACFGRYGPCDYRPICLAATPEKGRLVLADQFMVEQAHNSIELSPNMYLTK